MDWLPVGIVIALAMGFNYTNGFHDAANAIATSVSTRALTPRVALLMAAVANLFGGVTVYFFGKVAATVGKGIIEAPPGNAGLVICAAALIGAIGWNLLTWWYGLPSSSSHALIGGLGGAALAAGAHVKWAGILEKVVIPMILSPDRRAHPRLPRDDLDPVALPPSPSRARSPVVSATRRPCPRRRWPSATASRTPPRPPASWSSR